MSSMLLHDGPPAGAILREAALQADAAVAAGNPGHAMLALSRLADCHRNAGQPQAAQHALAQALAWSRLLGSADATVDLLCALCEGAAAEAERQDDGDRDSGRGHAAREEARAHAHEAALHAGHVADAQWEIRVLLRVSEVLDAFGDRDDALALQNRAIRLMSGSGPAPVDLRNAPKTAAC